MFQFSASQQHSSIYIFVYEVKQLHQEFKDNGVTTLSEPQLPEYGMLDFERSDPDGHILRACLNLAFVAIAAKFHAEQGAKKELSQS